MEFKKYNSIDNAYNQKVIQSFENAGYSELEWCVMEKLHGSCVSIYCDGVTCQTASRNHMLSEHESDLFYKFGTIKSAVYERAKDLFHYFADSGKYGEVKEIILYGELFGGIYPHEDVDRVEGVAQVQKGVYYSPGLHYHVFDIAVNGQLISYNDVERACKDLWVPYCVVLKRGTMRECLEYPNDFETTIPDILGLPKIKDNIAEGVVLKPVEPKFMPSGSRVILKNKNDKFKENNSRKKKVQVDVSDTAKQAMENISPYINTNRLDAVASKLGELEPKMIGAYIKEFVSDVFKDANQDGVISKHLEKVDQKALNKYVSTECRNLIMKRLRGEE